MGVFPLITSVIVSSFKRQIDVADNFLIHRNKVLRLGCDGAYTSDLSPTSVCVTYWLGACYFATTGTPASLALPKEGGFFSTASQIIAIA
jgi:hypothetical protein